MNLKRLIALLLAALMLLGTLVACGGDPKESESDTQTAAPAESGDETGENPGDETGEPTETPATEEPSTDETEGVTPEDTDETEVPTEDPGDETEGQGEETKPASGTTTKKPSSGTTKPAETTAKPTESSANTTKPGTTTTKPGTTTAKPGTTTTKPPETTKPVETKDPYEEVPVDNTAIKAPNEDSSLRLWFDHAFGKTAQTNTTSTGRNTYKMYMGKNEIEDCQFYLSSNSDKTGLTAELSSFKDKSGRTIAAELYFFVYFNVESEIAPDAIPPYNGDAFTVKANTSKGFLIKVKTTATTAAGEYEATLNIKNSKGQIVKTAKVYLKVWNFTLDDASACRTAMDFGSFGLYGTMLTYYPREGVNWAAGDNNVLYLKYYDYLLENRISPYSLPWSNGSVLEPKNEPYMNNPRMTAFNAIGWKQDVTPGAVSAAYNKLKQNPEWLKKAYFYHVDEPMTMEQLEQLRRDANIIKANFPGYKLMAPFEFATILDVENNLYDYIDYMSEDITLWVPKAFCFATYNEARKVKLNNFKPMMSSAQERAKGTFWQRMQNEVKGGDELWWYVSCLPTKPFVTMTIEASRLSERELFWQQKLYGVTGFLYFAVGDWRGDSWTPQMSDIYGVHIYGDGQLLYVGEKYGVDGPIGCLRLEAARDGIEDYEYFHMLEKKIGTAKVNELIQKITTSVLSYTEDGDEFAAQRVYVGNYLEDVLK